MRELIESYVSRPAIQNALRVIRFAEGTERGGPDSYRVMFGGGLAPDLKRHPDKVISRGGYSSSAAGAYQFLTPTWQSVANQLGLSDFSPRSQDLAATLLMKNRLSSIGGLATLEKEGFSPRVSAALAPEWASLPTLQGRSYYGQPVKNLSELQKIYGQTPPVVAGSTNIPATPAATSTPGSTAAINPTDFLKGFLLKQLLFNEQDAAPSLSNVLLSSMLKAPEKQDLTSDFLTANLYTPRSQFLESLTQF